MQNKSLLIGGGILAVAVGGYFTLTSVKNSKIETIMAETLKTELPKHVPNDMDYKYGAIKCSGIGTSQCTIRDIVLGPKGKLETQYVKVASLTIKNVEKLQQIDPFIKAKGEADLDLSGFGISAENIDFSDNDKKFHYDTILADANGKYIGKDKNYNGSFSLLSKNGNIASSYTTKGSLFFDEKTVGKSKFASMSLSIDAPLDDLIYEFYSIRYDSESSYGKKRLNRDFVGDREKEAKSTKAEIATHMKKNLPMVEAEKDKIIAFLGKANSDAIFGYLKGDKKAISLTLNNNSHKTLQELGEIGMKDLMQLMQNSEQQEKPAIMKEIKLIIK